MKLAKEFKNATKTIIMVSSNNKTVINLNSNIVDDQIVIDLVQKVIEDCETNK